MTPGFWTGLGVGRSAIIEKTRYFYRCYQPTKRCVHAIGSSRAMTTVYDAPLSHVISIALHPRQLVSMKIAVAEQFLADPGALHEEADIELVGHAHAAMHLHALLHRQRRGRTRARFCDRDRRACILKIRIERLQRLQHRGAGDLDLDVKLRGAVLQRLEFADQLAELLALLEIADGAAEHFLAEADHFRGHRAPADIEHALHQRPALIDLAEHAV